MSSGKNRVCVIGAGPSGLSALYQFGQMTAPPEVVCYEKQSTWGGMWNFTWRTGTDEFGEPCHNGMYKHLWTNTPKEWIEYPDYTYEQHYGKPLPSFVPRGIQRDYLDGRFKSCKTNLKDWIKFNHVVRYVRYDRARDEFTVTVMDLQTETTMDETFSHVIVATGIFNVPFSPDIPGIESFPGRVFHSHDYRDAAELKGQRILVVGSHYSAEDIAIQSVKFGAISAVVSYRSKPTNLKWPKGTEEKPMVERIDGNEAFFKDGSSGKFDVIAMATGYKYHFPYMQDDLRLISHTSLYPDNLYKGVLMTKGGNNKCFYIGAQNQYFSLTMFDVQACWVNRYIDGTLPGEPKSTEAMRKDIDHWLKRLSNLKNEYQQVDFQADYVADLCHLTGYYPDIARAGELHKAWLGHRAQDIGTFRDRSHRCIFTGKMAPPPRKPWLENFDDSTEAFLL